MILYIFVTAVTITLAYLCVYAYPGHEGIAPQRAGIGSGTRVDHFRLGCLVLIFAVLFLVSAFRMNVGNDYATYVEFMHRLYTDKYIADPGVPTEWGFNILARVIYALSGGENFILVFAIYAFATIALFLAAMWQQSEDFALSFFMFMTLGMYLQSFSTVRYYLALGIALYCMKFIEEKRWVSFLLLVLLGTGFHKSILVIVPLYLLATVKWKKWHLAVMLGAFVSCLFLKGFYLQILIKLYPSYEGTEYLAGSSVSYINIIRCILVLSLAVYVHRGDILKDDKNRFFFYLNLGALALFIFCNFIPVIDRIGYYLTVSQLIFVPSLIRKIPDQKQRRLAYIACIVICLMYFAVYLRRAPGDGVLVLPYRTFFFNDMVEILSDVL